MLKIVCLGILIIFIWLGISLGLPTFGIILNLAGVAIAIAFLANAKFRGKVGGILKLNPEKKTGSIFAGVLIPVFLFCLLLSFGGLMVEKDAIKQVEKVKQAKIEQENIRAEKKSKFEDAVKRGDQKISVVDFTAAKAAFTEALELKGYKGKKDKAQRGLLVSQINLNEEGVSHNYLQNKIKKLDEPTLTSILNENSFPAVLSTGNEQADAKLKVILSDQAKAEQTRREEEKRRKEEEKKKKILADVENSVKKLKESWNTIKQFEIDEKYEKALKEFKTLNSQIKIIEDAINYGFKPDSSTRSIMKTASTKQGSISKKREAQEKEEKRLQALIGNGTHIVGTDVIAGTYRSQGTRTCYWARLKGFGGQLDDIIANGNNSPEIVTIGASDAAFNTSGCGKWVAVENTYPSTPATSFSDGTYEVGKHIEPGTYRADGSPDSLCYWARLSNFSHAGIRGVITNGNSPTVIRISGNDKGFTTFRCGNWNKIK